MSTISMINNGKNNQSRTRHINLRYFWLQDRLKSGDLKVEYMKTDEMLADIFTKPIQGIKFNYLRGRLLNTSPDKLGIKD